jgi:hypothetical protein
VAHAAAAACAAGMASSPHHSFSKGVLLPTSSPVAHTRDYQTVLGREQVGGPGGTGSAMMLGGMLSMRKGVSFLTSIFSVH